MPAFTNQLPRLLVSLTLCVLLGLIGYLIGARQAQPKLGVSRERSPTGRELLALMDSTEGIWGIDEGCMYSREVGVDKMAAICDSVRLALYAAQNSERILEGDPIHVFAIHRLREPWARWIGVCSELGALNSRGGTSWPRMYRMAPFDFERLVNQHINLLSRIPGPEEQRGPSREKLEAMLKFLAIQREDYEESLAYLTVGASLWEMHREQLYDCGAIWTNEIAPFLEMLPTPVADDLIDKSLERASSTLYNKQNR